MGNEVAGSTWIQFGGNVSKIPNDLAFPDWAARRSATILFDLDGTLFDHSSAVTGALEEIFTTHTSEIARDEIGFRTTWTRASSSLFDTFEKGTLSWAQQGRQRVKLAFNRPSLNDDAADRFFATFVEAYEDRWELFPDALPCLERLRGRALGIVTNGHPQQQRKKLYKLRLREHFQEVLISAEIGKPKPSPGIFLEASRRLWTHPAECIVVGDSWQNDVEGGRNAGMQAVWLDRVGSTVRPGVPVVKGLAEIPDLVARW